VCDTVASLVADKCDRALLLGATPELTRVGLRVVSVEWKREMLAFVWPGNDAGRQAVQADWRELPYGAASFSCAIGDGSLNCLEYPCGYRRVATELSRVLRPAGRVVIRVFTTPPEAGSYDTIRAVTFAGGVRSVHALKWLLAGAIRCQGRDPNVPARAIAAAFNRWFPNRVALKRATGWTADEIAQIEAFENLPDVFSFPTRDEVLLAMQGPFTNGRWVPAGDYELADRCPIVVMDNRGDAA